MALNKKQMDFLDKYVLYNNAALAYREVYNCSQDASKSAWRILQKPEAKEYLQYAAAQAKSDRIAGLEECLEKITEIIRTGNQKEAIRALDMRLKTLGAYINKQEVTVDTPTTINVTIKED